MKDIQTEACFNTCLPDFHWFLPIQCQIDLHNTILSVSVSVSVSVNAPLAFTLYLGNFGSANVTEK